MPWSVETYGGHGHQYLARLNETARFVHRLGMGSAELASVAAIERVYRERFTSFLRLGYALLGNREQARDAVQEAFAIAIRSRGSFHGNGSLEGWLWTTMLNVCRQEHRRRLRFSDDQPPEVAGNGRPHEWPELRALIAALPERERHAIYLRYFADLRRTRLPTCSGFVRARSALLSTTRATSYAPRSKTR